MGPKKVQSWWSIDSQSGAVRISSGRILYRVGFNCSDGGDDEGGGGGAEDPPSLVRLSARNFSYESFSLTNLMSLLCV